jgi:hypothetical protein
LIRRQGDQQRLRGDVVRQHGSITAVQVKAVGGMTQEVLWQYIATAVHGSMMRHCCTLNPEGAAAAAPPPLQLQTLINSRRTGWWWVVVMMMVKNKKNSRQSQQDVL